MNEMAAYILKNNFEQVAKNIVEGYEGGASFFDNSKNIFIIPDKNLSIISTGMQTTVHTNALAGSIAINLIAMNNLCWKAYGAGNELMAEYWADLFHNLRNEILSDSNPFKLTDKEISDILTIID